MASRNKSKNIGTAVKSRYQKRKQKKIDQKFKNDEHKGDSQTIEQKKRKRKKDKKKKKRRKKKKQRKRQVNRKRRNIRRRNVSRKARVKSIRHAQKLLKLKIKLLLKQAMIAVKAAVHAVNNFIASISAGSAGIVPLVVICVVLSIIFGLIGLFVIAGAVNSFLAPVMEVTEAGKKIAESVKSFLKGIFGKKSWYHLMPRF